MPRFRLLPARLQHAKGTDTTGIHVRAQARAQASAREPTPFWELHKILLRATLSSYINHHAAASLQRRVVQVYFQYTAQMTCPFSGIMTIIVQHCTGLTLCHALPPVPHSLDKTQTAFLKAAKSPLVLKD